MDISAVGWLDTVEPPGACLAPPEGYFLLSGRQPFDTFCGRDVEKILKAPEVFHPFWAQEWQHQV